MRKLSFAVVCLASILVGNMAVAQPVPDHVYHKRLYYTGKVWGFVKYFHSEVATGTVNWDVKLIDCLSNVKGSVTNKDFNDALSGLLDAAGEMALPTTSPPDVPDSLKYNLDLSWLDDEIFSHEVRARLDTIRVRFRPQSNAYVGASSTNNPTFYSDGLFYEYGGSPYPSEELRILALFRYWNIISYFFPYKYMMDQNWDSTLVEFIPRIVNAHDEMSFQLSFLELTTRLNDTHAYTSGAFIDVDICGLYFLPLTLQHIENETVVTGVFAENVSLEIGDIIKSINGLDIYALRDSIRTYVAGSNNHVIEKRINEWMLRGPNETVQMVVEDSEGQKNVTLSRVFFTEYNELIAKTGPVWSILETGPGTYGYVDMGRLEVAQIGSMFDDLWDTDGIIFDIRNYPRGTVWTMIRYLFDAPIHMAQFTKLDVEYPGTLFWHSEYAPFGDFSQTYGNDIFILFDERSISQAEYTVMSLEQHPRAIKIGSQTAGADGSIADIYLPGGIHTKFTGMGVFYPDYTETQRIGIVPDVEVHPTIAGIREGRDELIEAALKLCCKLRGDVNRDGVVNALDFQYLCDYLHQDGPEPCLEDADVNGDGVVDTKDMSCLARHLFSPNNSCEFVECP